MASASQNQGPLIPSARRLHMKTLQNQLADAQLKISHLFHENRVLRTVLKRQDSALSMYESRSAELPQLLQSHSEELRVGQAKHRSLQAIKKVLEQTLKQTEAVILSLSDQNKDYSQLNKDKSLEPLHRLTDKLNRMQREMHEKDKALELFTRKSQIEIETLKEQLQIEQRESKKLKNKLEKGRLELSELRKRVEPIVNPTTCLEEEEGLLTEESDNSLNNPAEEPIDYMLSIRSRKIGTPKLQFSPRSTGTIKELGDSTPRSASTIAISALASKPQKQPEPRTDRGDGDAAVLNEIENYNKQNKLPPEEPSSQAEYSGDFEDTNDMDEDETTGADIIPNGTDEDIGNEMQLNDDDAESKNSDDVREYQNKIPVPYKLHSARTKKEVSLPNKVPLNLKNVKSSQVRFAGKRITMLYLRSHRSLTLLIKAPGNRKKKLLVAPKSIDDKNPWNKTTSKIQEINANKSL